MTTLPRLSEESESWTLDSEPSSTKSSHTANFSRPRPFSGSSYSTVRHDKSGTATGQTHSISAFHEPNRDLPAEPRFSSESERTGTVTSDNSAGSDKAWDGQRGELKVQRRHGKYDQQRSEAPREPTKPRNTAPADRPSVSSHGSYSRHVPASSSSSKLPMTKSVPVDQRSETISLSNDGVEDDASHHTVSDDEDYGSYDLDGNWQSSTHSTLGLSDAKIRKLRSKGINPSLYVEMKAAKKGRNKLVGPLLGNSFLG